MEGQASSSGHNKGTKLAMVILEQVVSSKSDAYVTDLAMHHHIRDKETLTSMRRISKRNFEHSYKLVKVIVRG